MPLRKVITWNVAHQVKKRPIPVYMVERFPEHVTGLEAIVDLLPTAYSRYYHPAPQGRRSIKIVLPCIVPDLSYGDLEGVADGKMASAAYRRAIAKITSAEQQRVGGRGWSNKDRFHFRYPLRNKESIKLEGLVMINDLPPNLIAQVHSPDQPVRD